MKAKVRVTAAHYKAKDNSDLLLILGLFFLIYFVGIFLFHNVEGWSYLDSAYFVTATVTTIGYGDIVPVTETGKLLTIIFSWLGVSTGFFLLFKISEWRRKNFDLALLTNMEKFYHRKKGRNSGSS